MSSSELMMKMSRRVRMLLPHLGSSLIGSFPQVSKPANRPDVHAGRLDLGTQPRNVHLNRVGSELIVETGETVRDLLLAENASRMRDQQLQQRPFTRRKLDRPVMGAHALGCDVDAQPRDQPLGGRRHETPPQCGPSRFAVA